MMVEQYWKLGNTGWRNPERLPSLLKVLDKLIKKEKTLYSSKLFWDKFSQESLLTAFINENVLSIKENSQSNFNGLSKAFSSLKDHGFINKDKLSNEPFLTNLGKQLVEARNKSAKQLIFAQALSQIEIKKSDGTSFSPLIHVLKIAKAMKKINKEQGSLIKKDEMIFILSSTNNNSPEDVAGMILEYRERKKEPALGNVKSNSSQEQLFREEYVRIKNHLKNKNIKVPSEKTFLEYIDVTLRHLSFTGLFNGGSDRGFSYLSLASDQMEWINALIKEDNNENIWNDPKRLTACILKLNKEIEIKVKKFPHQKYKWTPLASDADLLSLRTRYCDLRETLSLLKRGDLFSRISQPWIVDFLLSVPTKKTAVWINGEEVDIGSSRPAILEWAIFASLVSSHDRPHSSYNYLSHEWRGSYDHKNLPSSTAAGQGEDAWVDLGESMVCVETTTTVSDRQFATEGQSVSRHVVERMIKSNKPVWGLFIAPKLDLNTIGAYQSGWYIHGFEEKTYFPKIIPFTINQWQVIMDNFVQRKCWDAKNIDSLLSKAWNLGQSTEIGSESSSNAKKWRDALCVFVDSIEEGSYFSSVSLESNLIRDPLKELVPVKRLISRMR